MKSDNPSLRISAAGERGFGVFAARRIEKDEVIFQFTGPELSFEEIADFSHAIQCDFDRFICASGGVDDYVNHSCNPNCGLRSTSTRGLELFALEPIDVDAELSFDYSTCMELEDPWPTCLCGSPRCRGKVTAFRDLEVALRQSYRDRGALPLFQIEEAPGQGSTGNRTSGGA